MATRKTLGELRKEIDSIDARLVALISKRALTAQQIGEAKSAHSRDVLDVAREKAVLRAVRDANTERGGPLRGEAMEAIFREIISACRASQQATSVAFLGPEGTFSHAAALKQFGRTGEFHAVDTIADVFTEVEAGRVSYGIAPIENTTEGAVTPTLDALARTTLSISAEVIVKVDHYLMALEAEATSVRRIVSHPQPLAQCRRYLADHYPGVELQETASTAAAARIAAEEEGTAAIASRIAAELYGLEIVAPSIQDQAGNVTRFIVVGEGEILRATGEDRTSLCVSVRDEVGVLGRILAPFTANRVNLSMIESRPLAGRPWEYSFFIDIGGHVSEGKVKRALAQVAKSAISVKVLGSYPVAA
ncbi:MAG: prephenate dehydratase [Myxococcales bacterium]|nr:MAG: prephenate dehydratase [Myxococcales bacterium]